jgi:hypothetical protein
MSTEWERTRPPLKRITSPAEPGNVLALKHGAYSPRSIEAEAGKVHEALLEVAPWCDQPQYLPSVNRYLEASAREALAHRALMASSPKLSPRLLEAATSAARLAWLMGDQLGLTPAGHARLKVMTAASVGAELGLQDLIADGAAIRARRQAAVSPVGPLEPTVAPDTAHNPQEAL